MVAQLQQIEKSRCSLLTLWHTIQSTWHHTAPWKLLPFEVEIQEAEKINPNKSKPCNIFVPETVQTQFSVVLWHQTSLIKEDLPPEQNESMFIVPGNSKGMLSYLRLWTFGKGTLECTLSCYFMIAILHEETNSTFSFSLIKMHQAQYVPLWKMWQTFPWQHSL